MVVEAAEEVVAVASGSPEHFYQKLLGAALPPQVAFDILDSDDPEKALASMKSGASGRDWAAKIELQEWLDQGVRLLQPDAYPEQLASLPKPYPALWTWGHTDCLHAPCIAIVGTRRAGAYGKAVAAKFAEKLAAAGVTIVSGGASGIDAAAHQGAMAAGGSTVAVCGGGVDQVFPAHHDKLFEKIRRSGCLVSQFAIGVPTIGHRFLTRNHLIASLSHGVLVIEAPAQSGSLTTATTATDLNRPVFVIPGPIDNLNFAGSHKLIREGASLVDHPDQILEELGVTASALPPQANKLTGAAAKIFEALSVPLRPEQISQETHLDTVSILSELTLLELEGLVASTDGIWRRN